jgi:predicted nucleic acid-binding protein
LSRIVVDASAVAAWLLPDEAGPVALDELAHATLDAPWLFWAELRNILIVSERRGRLPVGAGETFLSAIDALNVRLDAAPLEPDVMRIARAHGLTVYDALYLELALRLGAPLATLDGRLAEAARRSSVAVLG